MKISQMVKIIMAKHISAEDFIEDDLAMIVASMKTLACIFLTKGHKFDDMILELSKTGCIPVKSTSNSVLALSEKLYQPIEK
jgi:uncharacterized iron-regulated protein